jgi:PhnB protein
MAKVKQVPDGYHSVTPYLIVEGASDAIDWYGKVLGAKERMRMSGPDNRVGHAELELGDSVIMLADEFPDMGARGPKTIGGSPVSILVYVPDVDTVFDQAVKAGATAREEPADKFYGDRSATFEDPFGQVWNVATHVEDVPPDEMAKRAAEMMGGSSG